MCFCCSIIYLPPVYCILAVCSCFYPCAGGQEISNALLDRLSSPVFSCLMWSAYQYLESNVFSASVILVVCKSFLLCFDALSSLSLSCSPESDLSLFFVILRWCFHCLQKKRDHTALSLLVYCLQNILIFSLIPSVVLPKTTLHFPQFPQAHHWPESWII